MNLQAIQTEYRGYLFRSRLEARWAVFFDALGLRWEFEPEGFELGDGARYLPDFCVIAPNGSVAWYEVKPGVVKSDEKLANFQAQLDARSLQIARLLSGDPRSMFFERSHAESKSGHYLCPNCGLLSCDFPDYSSSLDVYLDCWLCDVNLNRTGNVLCETDFHKGRVRVSFDEWGRLVRRLKDAADKARSARFEHGQSGVAA